LIRAPHARDNLLRLRLGDAALLSHDLGQHGVDFPRHVRCVAADVEIGFLLEELVDFFGVLLEAVLHVNLVRAFAGEGGDEGEFIAEGFFVLLVDFVNMWKIGRKGGGLPPTRMSKGNLQFAFCNRRRGVFDRCPRQPLLERLALAQIHGMVLHQFQDQP